MGRPITQGEVDAVILFVDIVDSSKYSSVLGFTEYAKRLIDFQAIFRRLGEKYFPKPKDKVIDFCEVNARGDEGTIFCLAHDPKIRSRYIFRAIEFLFHLKGIMYFGSYSNQPAETQDKAPIRMGIGAGIHVGKVAYLTSISESNRKEISQIEGYSINKAKRIESSSRQGKHSRIVLSKEAVKLVEGEPILFEPFTASLKGIDDDAELYEVRSGLFSGLKLKDSDYYNEKVIAEIKRFASNPSDFEDDWLKSFAVSVFYVLHKNTFVAPEKEEYRRQQEEIVWHYTNEDDPILLFMRASIYKDEGEITQQIRYLQQILGKYQNFIFAQIKLIEAFWKLSEEGESMSEKIWARDLASELLLKFESILEQNDIELLKTIIKKD